jgi:hypothetical protein
MSGYGERLVNWTAVRLVLHAVVSGEVTKESLAKGSFSSGVLIGP